MSKNFDEDYDKTIEGALKDGDKIWTMIVEGDLNDADYGYIAMLYNDKDFKEEGLPVSIIFNSIQGEYLSEHDWINEALMDYIPRSDASWAHTINSVKVYKNGRELNLNKIDADVAAEAVRRFLNGFLEDEDLEEAIEDLSGTGIALKRKKYAD